MVELVAVMDGNGVVGLLVDGRKKFGGTSRTFFDMPPSPCLNPCQRIPVERHFCKDTALGGHNIGQEITDNLDKNPLGYLHISYITP